MLVEFELPPQYCGVLQYFFQFTDLLASDATRIDTPDLEWTIRVNGHPLHPYLGFQHIVNPWGTSVLPDRHPPRRGRAARPSRCGARARRTK